MKLHRAGLGVVALCLVTLAPTVLAQAERASIRGRVPRQSQARYTVPNGFHD